MANTRTFICEDCKFTIYSFGYDDGKDLCGMCQWLRDYINSEKERERITKLVRNDLSNDLPN